MLPSVPPIPAPLSTPSSVNAPARSAAKPLAQGKQTIPGDHGLGMAPDRLTLSAARPSGPVTNKPALKPAVPDTSASFASPGAGSPVIEPKAFAATLVRLYGNPATGRVRPSDIPLGNDTNGDINDGLQQMIADAGGGTQSGATADQIAKYLSQTLSASGSAQISFLDAFNLAQSLGKTPTTGPVKTLYQGQKLTLSTTIPTLMGLLGARPQVFFNYDETVLPQVAGPAFRAVGQPLSPMAASFDVSSSHNNGNPDSPLVIGFRLQNHGSQPLTLTIKNLQVGAHGVAMPVTDPSYGPYATFDGNAWHVTVPPNGQVDFPAASTAAHPNNGTPRDGSRMVTYQASVDVTAGDPKALQMTDIARFPKSTNATPHDLPDTQDKKHHQGVFLPQVQISPPVLLSPGVEAGLSIAGSQATHDAHYNTPETFYVALPKDAPPKALVFRGGGGNTQPAVNGRVLPSAVGVSVQTDAQGNPITTPDGYAQLKQQTELTVPMSQASRYLTPTGHNDASGNPIYAITVTYLPGSNGDLGLYAQY